MVVTRGWGKGKMGSWCSIGIEFLFYKPKNSRDLATQQCKYTQHFKMVKMVKKTISHIKNIIAIVCDCQNV